MDDQEVTRWLGGLAQQESSATRRVWECYYDRMVNLARRKLGESRRRAADEEDVALSAFASFCEGAAAGRFPRLEDRHDLWKLLVAITARKAAAQIRHSHRQKRGGGTVRGESVFAAPGNASGVDINAVFGASPTPEVAAMVAEQCSRLLESLQNDTLRQIAMDKLAGYTNAEIAERSACAPRTVERRLASIRECWEQLHGAPT